jgi:hypothetical protein
LLTILTTNHNNPRHRRESLGRFLPLLLGLVVSVEACQICLPFPTISLADHILVSSHLVIARENPNKPFTLHPVRTLVKGEATPAALELFLDTSSRRQLALNEELTILCGWSDQSSEWQRLALYDETLAPVIFDILENRQNWKANPEARVRYFADFLAHEETVLSDLAHLEVARAPYEQVIQFADRLPREELHKRIADLRRIEWHALYILLLAKSGNSADQQFIRDQFESNARFSTALQTAAWTTAMIEIDGVKGVQRVSELYLENTKRTPQEFSAIHAALRVHGDQGKLEHLDLIVTAYGKLLEIHPEIAPELAEDLTRWRRFDHTEKLTAILGSRTLDLVAVSKIRSHLRATTSGSIIASGPSKIRPSLNGGIFAFVCSLLLIPLIFRYLARRNSATNA